MLKIDFSPPVRVLRQFGWISLVGFPLIALVLGVWQGLLPAPVSWALVGLGVGTAGAAAVGWWSGVGAVYVAMSLIAIPIGFVLSNVLLALIHLLLFTPIGLWFRLIGRDAMQRKLRPEAGSYWVVRDAAPPPARYFRLY